MKIINPDDFRVVNKIELSNITTELNIDADDYKNEVLNQI
jgi:glutamine cyclotransferase